MTKPTQTQQGAPSSRTELKRVAERGNYEHSVIRSILEESFLAHVSVVYEGQPRSIPMAYGLKGDQLLLHGSTANRLLRTLRDGAEACVNVTMLDGLVLARSAFHHSVNFRSVVVFAKASEVVDPQEKCEAFRCIVNHIVPGRSADAREPNENELARTMVLSLPINEASAKLRSGGPIDDEEDYDLTCWAGVIPISSVFGEPVPCERLHADIATPDYVSDYSRSSRSLSDLG